MYAAWLRERRPDDHVVNAVAVHVARSGHGAAAPVVGRRAVHGEAVGAVERAQLERGREAGERAEHHVALTGEVAVAIRRADDEIADAVTVHVPRRADREAARVERIDAVDGEAVGAVESAKIEGGAEVGLGAEHHVALTRAGSSAGIGLGRADDEIADAVAVHVSRRAHRLAAQVARVAALNAVAVAPVKGIQFDRRAKARRRPEYHIALAGTGLAAWISEEGADDQVIDAVAVHVARTIHRVATVVIGIDTVNDETVGSVEATERDRGAEPVGAAEHDVALAGTQPPVRRGMCRANDHVVVAVAVHIARGAH